MCGFLFCSFNLTDEEIAKSETLVIRRGPDTKNILRQNNCTYVHYLLHITGDATPQPLISSDCALVYNGEIYNYKNFGDHPSDGYAILDAYTSSGVDGIRMLDGEFGGVLHTLHSNKLTIIRDAFGTKPIVFSRDKRGFAVASYSSQLISLGFSNVFTAPVNSIVEIDLRSGSATISEYKKFDLRQFKTSYDDWCESFYASVKKRTENKNVKYFIGLSSGYDSGLISAVLNDLDTEYRSYSIRAAEDPGTLSDRISRVKHNDLIELSELDYLRHQKYLMQYCEPHVSAPRSTRPNGYDLFKDKGAVGTSVICEKAHEHGCRVYLSGQGSDEILSDYGFNGIPAPGFLHCTITGKFPADLEDIFPWENFYQGTQEEFLAKDENVGGSYGLETRYPFLDYQVVQEFLWLTSELKNMRYKAPAIHLLEKLNFPVAKGGVLSKVGFRANFGLIQNDKTKHKFNLL